MLYSQLFKLNSNGKSIQVWEIHHSEDFTQFWTVSGQLNGKMTTSGVIHVIPKVKRNQQEQCELEMNNKINLKRRNRYVDDVEDVNLAGESLPGYTPMLAKEYTKEKKKISFPCLVQPKLDGVRCLMTKDGMFTRGRKPIESCQHVWEELKPLFDFQPDLVLDGELYNSEFADDFESLIHAVRKSAKKATAEDLAFQRKLSYHVYDAPVISGFREFDYFKDRSQKLKDLLHTMETTLLVPTLSARSFEDIERIHDMFVADGWEGLMVRDLLSPYEGKRSDYLLKYKKFKEEEYKVTGVIEGSGKLAGHAGSFDLITPEGKYFRGKLEGSFDRLNWIWRNPEEVIGKMVTVQFQNYTKEGIPRFPVVKAVRGLEDRSDWL